MDACETWNKYLQVQMVKKQNDVFSFVVIKTNFFELSIDNSGSLEERGGFLNLNLSGGHFFVVFKCICVLGKGVLLVQLNVMGFREFFKGGSIRTWMLLNGTN